MSASLEAFAALLRTDDARIDLARACLLIAQDAYPELDVEHYLGEIERMALRLRGRLPDDSGAEARIIALNEFVFDELGFQGNSEDYYDPRNSYLNEVIDRRTGIPITLSVVYMTLGRRIGLPLEGVSFPGHFLVRLKLRRGVLMLDPFCRGEPQTEEDLRERLRRVVPAAAAAPVSVSELPLEQFLDPASNRQILARLLRNLKVIYRHANEPLRTLEVLNRMLVLAPDSSTELRDRGLLYRDLECWSAALKDLTEYLEREPGASDAEALRADVVDLAARCARVS